MKLDLQPRKYFELTLDSGLVIKGQLSTWATKRYCDLCGYTSLSQLSDSLNRDSSFNDVTNFLLACVEYVMKKSGEKFSYTDLQACDWIDEMGGPNGEGFKKLMNHLQDKQEAEKKSLENGHLTGLTSKDMPTLQD